ncbi:MAG: hypothetical protein Q9169_005512 [Polycauliona sp. 2 TL-2023]
MQGDEPLCRKALFSGYTVDGTFQQQYTIGKAAHVARIPKEISLDAVAPVLCSGITVYEGLKESGTHPCETVAVVGAGGGLDAADVDHSMFDPHGTVVAIGLPADAFLKAAPVSETVIGMDTIKGSYVGIRKDTKETLDFFKRGLIESPFRTIGMCELQKVCDMMNEAKTAGKYVVNTIK